MHRIFASPTTDFLPAAAAPAILLDLPASIKQSTKPSISSTTYSIALMAACIQPAATAAVRGTATPSHTNKLKPADVPYKSTEDYEEICILGSGAFGTVVKAFHRVTGETVAIKRLAAGTRFLDQTTLLCEAIRLAASSRDNPFVVGFHGVARDPATKDLCGLVMEFVGPSLSDILRHRRLAAMPPLPEALVRDVMRQLLTGTRKMHEAQVIHRDIKPDNILASDEDGTVKICDFGLSKRTDALPPYDFAGTLPYMAPEMLLGKPDYDARVDTWSLGCVMAELINGSRLFVRSSSAVDQLAAIFDLLGVPDETTWPWFSSTPFATYHQVMLLELYLKQGHLLRDEFPETKLSREGFQVLSGLLTCNPDKRLTAAAALKHPWFTARMNVSW